MSCANVLREIFAHKHSYEADIKKFIMKNIELNKYLNQNTKRGDSKSKSKYTYNYFNSNDNLKKHYKRCNTKCGFLKFR